MRAPYLVQVAALLGALTVVLVCVFWPHDSRPAGPVIADASSLGSVEERDTELSPTLPDFAPRVRAKPSALPPTTSEVPGSGDAAAENNVLNGIVTAEGGAPLRKAVVFTKDGWSTAARTWTDSEGRYSLEDLPSGVLEVFVFHLDYYEQSATLELSSAARSLRRDFTLRPKRLIWIRVVTSDGRPLRELLPPSQSRTRLRMVPIATRDDPGATYYEIRGSLNNRFGVGTYRDRGAEREARGAGFLGAVTLEEDIPVWVSLVASNQVVAKRLVDRSVEEVTLVVDPQDIFALRCDVRARLIDAATREPLEGQVWLGDDAFEMGPGHPVNSDGELRLSGQWPGERWLLARSDNRALHVRSVTLLPGETAELGELLLHPPSVLRGHARNAAGEPVEAILNWGVFDPVRKRVKWAQQRRAKSDSEGAFVIEDLEPALYALQSPGLPTRPPYPADASMRSGLVLVDATRGSVENLELVLHTTTPVTLETSGVQPPWPYALVLDESGLPAGFHWPGRYRDKSVVHLRPGRYELVIERNGVEASSQALVVTDRPASVYLDLR